VTSFPPGWNEPVNEALFTHSTAMGIPQRAALMIWCGAMSFASVELTFRAFAVWLGAAIVVHFFVWLANKLIPDCARVIGAVLRTPTRLDP
jgi:hypothetical protein